MAAAAREFMTLRNRLDRLEARVGTIEVTFAERFDALHAEFAEKLASMELAFTERFISVDERFSTLHLRIEQFEGRVTGALEGMRNDIALLSTRVSGLDERVDGLATQLSGLTARAGRFEDGLLAVSVRLDTLADDMRQRFRQVNERLAGAA